EIADTAHVGRAVGGHLAQAGDARAASGVCEPAAHRREQLAPETRSTEHAGEVGGVPAGEEHHRGVDQRLGEARSIGVLSGLQWDHLGRDAQLRVMVEPQVRPSVEDRVSLGRAGRGKDENGTVAGGPAEEAAIHLLRPRLELTGSEERVRELLGVAPGAHSPHGAPAPTGERGAMSTMRWTARAARRRMGSGTVTSKTPSRSERSSFAGVIRFMYWQMASSFTAWK